MISVSQTLWSDSRLKCVIHTLSVNISEALGISIVGFRSCQACPPTPLSHRHLWCFCTASPPLPFLHTDGYEKLVVMWVAGPSRNSPGHTPCGGWTWFRPVMITHPHDINKPHATAGCLTRRLFLSLWNGCHTTHCNSFSYATKALPSLASLYWW